MWMRKLYRSCTRLVDPTLEEARRAGATVVANTHKQGGAGPSTADSPMKPVGVTKVPVSKRMSLFPTANAGGGNNATAAAAAAAAAAASEGKK